MIFFLSFALPLGIYLSSPSTFWNFDGIACAAALELGKPAFFFHANHLLYGFLGFIFWRTVGALFHMQRALPALQLFTSLLSVVGLAGLYKVFLDILDDPIPAFLVMISLSVTAAFWMWSLEAQVYPLGFAALAWATYLLLHDKGRDKAITIGILHGVGVLGHVVHVLWIIPALLFWRNSNPSNDKAVKRSMARYATAVGITVLCSYALVIFAVLHPFTRGWNRVGIWLKGSAGLNADRHWQWHFPGFTGPWTWFKSTFSALWSSFDPYIGITVSPWLWVLTGIAMAIFFGLILYSWKARRTPLWLFAAIWLSTYGIFFWTWEPGMLCYRMTDVIPFGIFLCLGLPAVWSRWSKALILEGLFLTTIIVNAVTRIRPMNQPERNANYMQAVGISQSTPSSSLYLTDGGLLWMYLLYFSGRLAINAAAMDAERVLTTIEEQRTLRPIYVQSSLLREPRTQEWLSKLKYRQLKETSEWLQLQ